VKANADGTKDIFAWGNKGWAIDPPRLTATSDYADPQQRAPANRSAPEPRHQRRANVVFCDDFDRYCSSPPPAPQECTSGGDFNALREVWQWTNIVCSNMTVDDTNFASPPFAGRTPCQSNGLLTQDTSDATLFRRLGSSRLARTVCAAATGAANQALYGKMPSITYQDFPEARFILLWGVNPSSSGIHIIPYIREAQKRGAVLVVVQGPWAAHRFGGWRLVAIGSLLGAATLVRPVSMPILAALLVAWLLAGFGWRALAHTAVVTAVVVAVLAPWVVRNAVVMDAALVSTNTGDNLCMSRRVGGSGGFEFPNFRCNSGPFDSLPRPAYEVERDAQGRRLALDFVRDHPVEELRLVFRRTARTLANDDDAIAAAESYGDDAFLDDGVRLVLSRVSNVCFVVAGVGGVAGLVVLAVRRRADGLAVVLIAVSLLSAPLLSFGDPRFKVPAVPLVAIGVGVMVDALASRRKQAPATA
jgi:prepilin-type processing-associated H-X9-DG protein